MHHLLLQDDNKTKINSEDLPNEHLPVNLAIKILNFCKKKKKKMSGRLGRVYWLVM